ncbi:plasmid recombination protein [Janthinobacterium sp. 75]|uniref:plasmid recombination protein n=1 Tax=Janthinobacterium sp. 75 TaxID=2135628 RepID=UPI001416EDA8|nr:plasmid recombination protein [Janthinobacterium sp. 75]
MFLRMKGLKGKAIIVTAAKHNLREILAELDGDQRATIDPSRTPMNCIVRGAATAAGVASEARALMAAAGITTLRKDALRGIEIIFSLPAGTTIDQRAFFDDALSWAAQWFSVPILSAIVHNDEAAPHCHVILLPLVDGRMRGSELMGNRMKIMAMQGDFHAKVGQRYGLVRQAAPARPSAARRQQAIDAALAVLEANSGLKGGLLRVLLEPHKANPEPLLLALGIAMPAAQPKTKRADTFAGIMTRPCKPERKPIGVVRSKPIGFVSDDMPKSDQPLSCVGVAEVAAIKPTYFQHQVASGSTGTQQAIEPASASSRRDMSGSAPAASSAYSTIATTGPVEQATAGTAAPDYFQTVSLAQHQAEAEAGNFSGIPSVPSIEPAEVVFSVPECDLVPKGPPRAAPVRRASTSPAAHAAPGNYIRQRDADQPAVHWDSERGEFMPATGPPSARTLRIALESVTPYRPTTGQKVEA